MIGSIFTSLEQIRAVMYMSQGGTQFFSVYVGSDPASIVHPKKYQELQAPQKIFEILATQKISQFCTLTLKKTLKCIEMTLKLAQFCDDPKKYPQNLHTPQKYSFFSKPPKILKFRILNPKKWSEPTYM